MAWTNQSVGNGEGSGSSKTSSSNVSATIGDTIPAGNVLIVAVACDNTSTSDGDNSEVTSVTDNKSNTYTKIREFTNAQTGAGAGATISLWYSKLTTGLFALDTVTANFVSARTAKAIGTWEFSIGSGNVVTVQAGDSLADDGADPSSMNLTTPNAEFLWIRAVAHEGSNDDVFTKTAAYGIGPSADGTVGNPAASNMCYAMEMDIFTGTSNASDPTYAAADHASVLVALKEAAPAAGPSPGLRTLSMLGAGI